MSSVQRLSTINEIKSFVVEFPDKSLGEIFYSFLRPMSGEGKIGKISDLLELTDDEILSRVENAKRVEDGE